MIKLSGMDVMTRFLANPLRVNALLRPEMGTIWTVSLKVSVPTLASPMRTDMLRDAEAVLVLVLDF